MDPVINKKREGEALEAPKGMHKKAKNGLGKEEHEIIKFMNETRVVEVLPMMKSGDLVFISPENSLWEALEILTRNKILSAPIFNTVTKKCYGFLDMIDIAASVVEIASTRLGEAREEENEETPELEEKLVMEEINVQTVADYSGADPFLSVSEEANLVDLAKILKLPHHRRVAIISKDDESLKGIISQSGFAEYFLEEEIVQLLKEKKFLQTKIGELHLPSEVITIDESMKAFDAFKLMKEKKISGLPVTRKGIICDIITVSDLTLWSEWVISGAVFRFANFNQIYSPILEYLEATRSQKKDWEHRGVITCKRQDNLEDIMNLMLVNNIHRICVVDEMNKPISVVNYGDIISRLVEVLHL